MQASPGDIQDNTTVAQAWGHVRLTWGIQDNTTVAKAWGHVRHPRGMKDTNTTTDGRTLHEHITALAPALGSACPALHLVPPLSQFLQVVTAEVFHLLHVILKHQTRVDHQALTGPTSNEPTTEHIKVTKPSDVAIAAGRFPTGMKMADAS
ncbi:MAG: hypothetical protein FRX49_04406 [Trebouxia sp. A1-2]|nr:MAG: hypothetical protein FRX49_04406 [Trebouxia sp. A1-2]